MEKRLYKDEFHKKIGGVCAGLADYFTIDVTIVRLFFVLACIFHGSGLPIYIVLWIVLPKKPFPYMDPRVDYTVPPQGPEGTVPPTGNPFGGNPFQGNPFTNVPPQPNPPFQPAPRNTSLTAMIFGVILIVVGGTILLDNLDILPDWDFWHLWPVIPILIGCMMMLSGEKKKKDLNAAWESAKEDQPASDTTETSTPE